MSYRFLKDDEGNLFVSPLINVEDVAAGVRKNGQEEGYGEGYGKGYNDGVAQGLLDGQDECEAKHLVLTIKPETTSRELKFSCPFEPAFLTVYGFMNEGVYTDPDSLNNPYIPDDPDTEGEEKRGSIAYCNIEFAAGGTYSGARAVFLDEGNSFPSLIVAGTGTTKIDNIYSRDDEGNVTLFGIYTQYKDATTNKLVDVYGYFVEGCTYTVVAAAKPK